MDAEEQTLYRKTVRETAQNVGAMIGDHLQRSDEGMLSPTSAAETARNLTASFLANMEKMWAESDERRGKR